MNSTHRQIPGYPLDDTLMEILVDRIENLECENASLKEALRHEYSIDKEPQVRKDAFLPHRFNLQVEATCEAQFINERVHLILSYRSGDFVKVSYCLDERVILNDADPAKYLANINRICIAEVLQETLRRRKEKREDSR